MTDSPVNDEEALARGTYDRRSALGLATVAAGACYLVTQIPQMSEEAGELPPDAPTMLSALASLLLPQTATSRAGAPDDVRFMLMAFEKELFGATPWMLRKCWNLLNRGLKPDFLGLPESERAQALTDFDTAVFDGRITGTGWPNVKAVILASYYSSEVGATRELNYELVPGRFDSDLPVTPETRSYASEWLASRPVKIEVH